MFRSRSPNRAWATYGGSALAALLGSASALVFQGYRFGDGDHDDVLPLVLRAIDPGLYPLDAHVGQAAGSAVRSAYVQATALIARLLGLEAGVAVLHALTLGATAAGVYTLALALVRRRAAALLATALACGPLAHWTLGGNALAYAHFVPESLAWPFLLFALLWALRARALPAGALTALGAWFHPLAGLLVACILLPSVLLCAPTLRSGVAGAVRFGSTFALVAAPVLIPVLLEQRAERFAVLPYGLTGFEAYSQIRFPHHHLPTAFSAGSWARTGLLLALGLVAGVWRYQTRPSEALRRAAWVAAVAAVSCVLVGVGTVVFSSLTLARVQVFRITVVLNVLACALVAGAAYDLLRRRGSPRRKRLRQAPGRHGSSGRQLAESLVLRLTAWIGLTAWVGLAVWMLTRPVPATPLVELERWARVHLPPDALVAVPPGNTTFRVGARRSVVATWKATPFRLDALAHWLRDLDALAPGVLSRGVLPPGRRPRVARGVPERLDAAFAARDAQGWLRLGQTTGATVALVPRPTPAGLTVLHTTDPDAPPGWALVSLRPLPAAP